MTLRPEATVERMNERGIGRLPGLFGLQVLALSEGELRMQIADPPRAARAQRLSARRDRDRVADTACGYACLAHLPEGAENFTTVELKTNFLGTVTEGTIEAVARGVHLGRTTQVWDATVQTAVATGKTIALFRCTQMILWPKR